MKTPLIIAGFSGIGKTMLAKKYKNVIDLDSSEFVYDDSDIIDIPFEKRKGIKNRKKNLLWPQNYINTIISLKEKGNYDIILVWDREDIIKEYLLNKIDFVLCYPSKEDLYNYSKRFKNRGNTEEYIQFKLEQYNEKMEFFKELNVEKIILPYNYTLEDYLKSIDFKLEDIND